MPSTDDKIVEAVSKAKKPGTFSIVKVVKERGYPKDSVNVYLNEDLAYQVAQVNEAIDTIGKEMDTAGADPKVLNEFMSRRDAIFENRDALLAQMSAEKYVFHVKGMSEGQRQDLFDKAVEAYPIVIIQKLDQVTGEFGDVEVESVERDRLFTTLLWEHSIEKIVTFDGDVQEGITEEDAWELRRSLPLAALTNITESIERLRIATSVFLLTVDEDFLAKS